MKKLTLLGVICLALILTALPFMAACGAEEPAPVTPVPVTPAPVTPVTPAPAPVVVPAPAGEGVFTVLNPVANQPPIEVHALNPRLDTLDGKKVIVVNLRGGNEEAITSVGPDLQAAVPGCDVTSYTVKDKWGLLPPEIDMIVSEYDAAILGHNY